jgi:hypothetical protein
MWQYSDDVNTETKYSTKISECTLIKLQEYVEMIEILQQKKPDGILDD